MKLGDFLSSDFTRDFLMLQKCERVDFRAGAVFDGLKSRKWRKIMEKRIG